MNALTRTEIESRLDRPRPLEGKRILFVAPDDYPAFRVDLVELFSHHLVGRGLAIDWSLQRVDEGEAKIDERGSERFHVARRRLDGAFGKLRHAVAFARLRFALAREAKTGGFDLVLVRDSALWSVPYLLAARKAKKPFVFWMSYPIVESRKMMALDLSNGMGPLGRLLRWSYGALGSAVLYRFVLPRADHVVVQSERMLEKVASRGVPAERMTPVVMGVTTAKFNPETIAASDDPRLAGKKVMAYMAADLGGPPAAVSVGALADVVRRGHDAALVLIGKVAPEHREEIESQATALGVADRLVMPGFVPLAQALGYVKRADVCLSPFEMTPTQEVATPTKLVEYLALGRPVVASVHYDQAHVLSSSGAGYVTELSAEGMGEGAARLFADPVKAETMGARGAAWVKANRDYAAIADDVEDLLAAVVSGNGVRLP